MAPGKARVAKNYGAYWALEPSENRLGLLSKRNTQRWGRISQVDHQKSRTQRHVLQDPSQVFVGIVLIGRITKAMGHPEQEGVESLDESGSINEDEITKVE